MIYLLVVIVRMLDREFSRETGQEATVETFASALFGPSGKAKDEGQQVWQRETLFEAAIQSNIIFLLNELMLLCSPFFCSMVFIHLMIIWTLDPYTCWLGVQSCILYWGSWGAGVFWQVHQKYHFCIFVGPFGHPRTFSLAFFWRMRADLLQELWCVHLNPWPSNVGPFL